MTQPLALASRQAVWVGLGSAVLLGTLIVLPGIDWLRQYRYTWAALGYSIHWVEHYIHTARHEREHGPEEKPHQEPAQHAPTAAPTVRDR